MYLSKVAAMARRAAISSLDICTSEFESSIMSLLTYYYLFYVIVPLPLRSHCDASRL